MRTRLLLAVIGAAATFAIVVGSGEAVVAVSPTWPIPADAHVGPPPIPSLPAAGPTAPPADQIADPVTPSASCGGWNVQSSYGNRWSTGSTWWEYQCTDRQSSSYDPCAGGGACNAFCPECWVQIEDRTDYFYWNGSDAVFYGQDYYYFFQYTQTGDPATEISAWWDGPTAQWYQLRPFLLTVSIDGAGSGNVTSSPGGIGCGYGCQASFAAGTVVRLTATPDPGSIFTGWSGDCSGTGSCDVTMDQARFVTATFTPNAFLLTVTKQGSSSGQVSSSPGGISCGNGCQASFDSGTTVTLTATPDPGSAFAGWSGDCSGAGSCQVTMTQVHSVVATFNPNIPPHASFTLSCTSLTCSFDGSGSSDPDGTIASYVWSFGDGASASGRTVSHVYARAGGYTASLTVADNSGASAGSSKTFNPISVSARGYKQNGMQKVDLAWTGASGTSFDVYRNGTRIASLQALSETDTVAGKGTFTYKICAAATSICSSDASVSF